MEAMELDADSLLTSASTDPMLGKLADPPAMAGGEPQSSQPPPTGSFIVLKNAPGSGPAGKVTQLGNINLSSLTPGQGARAAAGRPFAVMGRAAGSTPGTLAKFIISPSSSQTQASTAGAALPAGSRIAAPGQHHVRMVAPVPNTGGHGVRLLPGAAVPAQYRSVQPDTLASPAKTITLTAAQAQEMGLLSPRKVSDGGRSASSPQRIIIKGSPSAQNKPMAVAASSGQAFRFLAQSSAPHSATSRQGLQFVRVVGSAAQPASQAGFQQQQQQQPQAAGLLQTSSAGQPPLRIAIAPSQPSQRLLLPAAPPPVRIPADVVPISQAAHRVAPRPHSAASKPRNTQKSAAQRESVSRAAALVGRASHRPSETAGIRPRKPCNCTKSQCLKLYCDCFASGEFCNNCNCANCNNSLDHEEERQRAIRACLDRNPYAFKPKIGKSDNETRKHQKGCNCKKSGCLKNYCECYEAKIFCSSQCKCQGCKNHESAPSRLTRPTAGSGSSVDDSASLTSEEASTAGGRSRRKSAAMKVATFPMADRVPLVRVTQGVIDATIHCLITESCEPGDPERRVLNEFGRCLSKIIDYGSRRGDAIDGMV